MVHQRQGNLGPLPDELNDRPYWQYVSGKDRSMKMKILGLFDIPIIHECENQVLLRHLVIAGSCKWHDPT